MASAIPVDYHSLFRALPGNFLLLATDGTILDNSDRHMAVSLLPRELAVGRSMFEAFPGPAESQRDLFDSQQYVRQHRQAHTMALLRYDLERPAAQGGGMEERYWQITHHPILDEQGELRYILQTSEDVTEQISVQHAAERTARELAETQQRNTFILENLPVMVWTNRADGTPDYYNPRWEAFTGLRLGADGEWRETPGLIHPDDATRVGAEVRQAVAAGREYQLEFRLRRHDGQYRWVLARNVPRHNTQGELIMWVGTGTDIHDQKMLVQELLETNEQQALLSEQAYQAQREAQRQRESLYGLFMQAPALIAIARGPEHRHEFVNPPYQALFPDRELLGRSVAEVIPEAGRQGFVAILDRVYQSGEPFVGPEMSFATTDAQTGQQTERFFNVTYQPVRENGQIVGISQFSYDVTELVLTRRKLTDSRTGAQ